MRPPIALSVAGSDPSGGAGIQADLKTFTALGVYGCAVVTSLTAQNTQGVQGVQSVSGDFVAAQLTSVLDDLPVQATKVGMLANAEIASAVADVFTRRRADLGRLVLDPVMIATSGDRLLDEAAISVLTQRIIPLADVITPNLHEAAYLLGADLATDVDEMREQADELLALGARAVLLKGGHLRGREVVDVYRDGERTELLRGTMFTTQNTHGTGCTLSSAIAAQFARVARLAQMEREAGTQPPVSDDVVAIASAREYLASAIENAIDWRLSKTPESGHGPVNHLITVGA
ncbi:bifunctional hydroxymethylpyrimidine kinase/phosphomethylpyrimidine kinase [Dermabacteraceae bacterium P13138]